MILGFLTRWLPEKQSERTWAFLALGVIAFALILRVLNLNWPSTFYFDEVYHAFTATRYVQGDKQAYDPWAAPPEGFAFEWTHPPLAKSAMAASIQLFGEQAWAWRLPSAIFGTLSIVVTMIIAFQLFGSWRVSALAGAWLALDGLHLVMSRIGMNDALFLLMFLSTIATYLQFRATKNARWLAVSGAFLGAALATKWTAFYIAPVIGLDCLITWAQQKKLPTLQEFGTLVMVYVVLPILLYIASYAQYFWMGYTWEQFVELQRQMWWYHTKLTATHSYQSRPWQWIFDLRPVWMYANFDVPGISRNIYNLANPIFLWTGLAAVLYFIVEIWNRPTRKGFFLLTLYGFLWMPWLASPRIMFFYHYLPALPGLAILAAVWSDTLLKTRYRALVPLLFGLAGIWLALFWPNLTGAAVPTWFAEQVYYLLPGWR